MALIRIIVASFCLTVAAMPAWAKNSASFSQWLDAFRQDALSQGISRTTLDEAFVNVSPDEHILELDRKQPESVLTLQQYLSRSVNSQRIEQGTELLKNNRPLLEEIGRRYGVQPQFIVALWGIETNYGENTGGFSTIEALATLAYDGRRADFFRDELLKALKIIEADHISAADMDGSWAGAMGQCQFMPSSFLQYAVDYDHDGKHDIWNTQADVFASIANYLSSSGWDSSQGWGEPVHLPDGFDNALTDIKLEKPISEWKRLGITREGGEPLQDNGAQASVVMVGQGKDAVPYIIYGNYKVLLKWNRSRYFATAVSTLADSIAQ